jgi:hypothetical protein
MLKHLKSAYKHLKKMMGKEIRKGQNYLEQSEASDITLKDLRGRKKQVETSRLSSLKKGMKAKEAKKKHQHRLRSTPGEVLGTPSGPSSPHKEGKRWICNTRKQTSIKTKVNTKTALKRSK